MLRHTFCHISGVGPRTEQRLWSEGFETWDDVLGRSPDELPVGRANHVYQSVEESVTRLTAGDAGYFYRGLPSDQQWRMFPEFRSSAAFVDIETTGLGAPGDIITTIVMLDDGGLRHFVQGDGLEAFVDELDRCQLLVTYNGKCFDVPFISGYFNVVVPHAHIDLRYVLASLGYHGGLKGCEVQLGLDREDLAEVDGFFAVLLWLDYQQNGNPESLETLLAYNAEDVVNLSTLMVLAYNMKVSTTPFADRLRLPDPPEVEVPFQPHAPTIQRLKQQPGWPGFP